MCFSPRPIVSERNELLIQFLSDLSLTADGFIGHYKFRPKKIPTTTAMPVTTTFPVTPGKFCCLQVGANPFSTYSKKKSLEVETRLIFRQNKKAPERETTR